MFLPSPLLFFICVKSVKKEVNLSPCFAPDCSETLFSQVALCVSSQLELWSWNKNFISALSVASSFGVHGSRILFIGRGNPQLQAWIQNFGRWITKLEVWLLLKSSRTPQNVLSQKLNFCAQTALFFALGLPLQYSFYTPKWSPTHSYEN